MNQESKWKAAKLINISLHVIGALLILVSGFLEFSTSIVPDNSEIQFESIPLNGFNSGLWYVYFFFALVSSSIAFNINSVEMKAFFYFTLVLFGLLTAYSAFVSSFKWGEPISPSLEYGSFIGFSGLLIIIFSEIVFVPSKFYTRVLNVKQSLFVFSIYALLLSCAYLPYEKSEYGIESGINHNDFHLYWIFGLLLLVFGYRKTLISKILTFIIVGIAAFMYYDFHKYDYHYHYLNQSYEIGAYIASIAFFSLITYAFYMIFRKKKTD